MALHSRPGDPHQDTAEVKQFFDQWEIYRKIVDNDLLYHRDAYAAIGAVLRSIERPFSFLDLGAGDASSTAAVLSPLKVTRYEAVDLSGIALDLARQNVGGLDCGKTFVQGDYFQHVRERAADVDVAFIGLSLHHLQAGDKAEFFTAIHRFLAPGGWLIFYEPIRGDTESRDEVLARWWEVARHWNVLTSVELQKAKEHVFTCDYPEPLEVWRSMAVQAGFADMQIPFTDADSLYAVMACRR